MVLCRTFRAMLTGTIIAAATASPAAASFVTFFDTGSAPGALTAIRSAFRTSIGGGTVAGPNGNFGNVRREINWDAVPEVFSDPNNLPGNFFNVNSPRGVVFSTPGSGFLVSSAAGSTLFGFPSDFQTFSPTKLFVAQGSNVTDVTFFLPGTTTAATTSAFGAVFTDVEVAGATSLEFFDAGNNLLFTGFVPATSNQGLSFLGAVADSGERIARVRITAGANSIVSNGVLANPNDDVVAMDDFIYATPVPEPGSVSLITTGLLALGWARLRRRRV